MPTGGIFGTGATDLFCSGVATGSKGARAPAAQPDVDAARDRGDPRPGRVRRGPRDVDARSRRSASPGGRSWGQILSASARMYVRGARLFLGIGLLVIPIVVVITFLQWLVFRRSISRRRHRPGRRGLRGPRARDRHHARRSSVSGSCRLRRRARSSRSTRGDRSAPLHAYRLALRRLRPLLRSIALFVVCLGRPDADHVPDSRRASGSPSAGACSRPSSSSRIAGASRPCAEARASSAAAGSASARSSGSAPRSRSSPARCSGSP